MFKKIDIIEIIKTHNSTLVNNTTGKMGLADFILFYFLPLFMAAVMSYLNVTIDKDAVSILSGSLSIFVGLFFNIIVLIFDLIGRENRNKDDIFKLRELIYNISFIILLSIFSIVFAFLSLIEYRIVKIFCQYVTYSFCILFLLTILMVLKRMYIFFTDEIDTKLKKKIKLNP